MFLASGSTTLNQEVRRRSARESRYAEEPAVPADMRRLRRPFAFRNVRTRKRQCLSGEVTRSIEVGG
jgi:hypothetical protein